ncbi:MAG: CoA transferase, partial [Thermohalobaculum sp.]|nr:CoA transferase [Thermohalobaculum sp.]
LPNVAPSNVYPTRDGRFILIAANQDTVFARLAQAMGRPELAADARYASHSARGSNQGELDALIADWTRTHDAAPLSHLLEDKGVPCGDIYRAPEMLEDAHFRAREAIVRVAHPVFGDLAMQNVAPKLSRTPGRINHPGPALGAHNDEIFGGLLGLDTAVRDDLAARGIIGTGAPD